MGYYKEKEKYEKEIKNTLSAEDWKSKVMDEESRTCSNCKKMNAKIVALCSGYHLNWDS